MKRRIEALEARRRALLARSEEQRAELAYRLEHLRPTTQITAWTRHVPQTASSHPLAWIAAAIGLLVFLSRPHRLLSRFAWLAGAVSLASRALRLLRLFSQLRALRANYRSVTH